MNSLRVRIAIVLLASITLVVCLATLAAVLVGRYSSRENYSRIIAEQIIYLGHSALSDADHAGMKTEPVGGVAREDLSEILRHALRLAGNDWPIVVNQPAGAVQPIVSVEVASSRWLTLSVPDYGPPRDAWFVLGGWMLLIFIGTAGVSLVIAYRLTRPLVLLENVAARIGASGELAPIPEDGPAEVRATARALNRLSRNLRQAMESRMRLVAAAGHDLRTPLTRMRLRAEFLDHVERDKWLGNIDELERIAESAIALVREEAGHQENETIRLDELARSIADDLKALKLIVEVSRTAPVSIKGPPLALTRALRNLVTNAATHGRGAYLTVEERDERALLTIDDDGPGIPEPLIGRVFEPFFRVDQSRRQATPGAGLGLAIAHEIIQRAGGELTLSNKTRGGLRQVITLPGKSTAGTL